MQVHAQARTHTDRQTNRQHVNIACGRRKEGRREGGRRGAVNKERDRMETDGEGRGRREEVEVEVEERARG